MAYPQGNQPSRFFPAEKNESLMRKIGAFVVLLLLILAEDGLYKHKPNSKAQVINSEDTSSRAALVRLLDQGTALRERSEYVQAASLFEHGYREAKLRKDARSEAGFLMGIANCHFIEHRYQEALREYLAARVVLSSLAKPNSLVAVEGNLSSLYSQLGEYDAAIDAAKRGLAEIPPTNRRAHRHRAKLLIILATLYAHRGDAEAARELFRQGIEEADQFGDTELGSNAWDRLGWEFLLAGHLPQAEDALLEAYRIRKLNRLPSLGESYRSLGILRLEQGDLRSASTLLNDSIVESESPRGRVPQWRFYEARGRLRLAEGQAEQAYADFGLALELVRNYRLEVPASDSIRVGLEGLLQEVYASFVETGSRLYFETPRADLARETFEAVEENRAASLGARLREQKQLRRNLPPLYWDRLAQLESAESAALLDGGEGPRQTMRGLRSSLIELEAKAGGVGFRPRPDLLKNAQHSLGPNTLLFSFHLAQPISCLWVVSDSGLSMYQLPDRQGIIRQAELFRQAVVTGSAEAEQLGREVYRSLFGALKPEQRNKSRWLLSLDEGLFDLPFAALVVEGSRRKPVYLVETHSVRVISGAAMRTAPAPKEMRTAGTFVGIGDAIYNTADARWPGRVREESRQLLSSHNWWRPSWSWKTSAAAPDTLGLSRLPGSGTEVEACAREWDSPSILLKGREATKQNAQRALASGPAVVHFATHVLQGQPSSSSAQIALSVTDSGRDELLGPEEITGWTAADTGLVVLSGCSSGTATARPGAGLMGLTRAWLMAGARAVVATRWTTPDDVGVFFRSFYQQLRRSPARDPAEALRAAQIEALRSHDWRSQPKVWAAYFALGNY
jgi:CHAT domain-containing protein